jgi:hypothetical protein
MPLNITTGDTPIQVERVNALIYGPPGHGKTSLAFTAHEPLLLDFDNGSHRSAFRRDTVIVKDWTDVASLSIEDLKPYSTIVIDTVGRALDMLTLRLQEDNPKLRTKNGGLTLQGYGELKGAFTSWIRKVQLMGLDVVLVAHDREEKRGDEVVLRADIQGGSYAEIFKLADAVGYLHLVDGNKRVLEFNPSDYHTGKNPAGLKPIDVPDLNLEGDFFGDLLDEIKDSIGKIGQRSQEVKKLVTKWRKKINKAKDAKALTKLLHEAAPLEGASLKAQVWHLMKARGEAIGAPYVKDKGFVTVDTATTDEEDAA